MAKHTWPFIFALSLMMIFGLIMFLVFYKIIIFIIVALAAIASIWVTLKIAIPITNFFKGV